MPIRFTPPLPIVKKGRKRYLEIWGRPDGSEYQAMISEKQINQNKLEAGDTVVVNITAGKGLERAANFLKKCDGNKPVHIQGYFNEHSNGKPAFEAANRNIKTQFKLQNAAPNFETEHRGVYDAILPLDMRIDDPQVALIEDNGIDIETGADINTILLKNTACLTSSARQPSQKPARWKSGSSPKQTVPI